MASSFIDSARWFSEDYLLCRELFCEAINALQGRYPLQQQRCLLPQSAESLSCELARIGDPAARRVLVIISGTHGVEGYCGSAIQRFLLAQLAQGDIRLPDGLALIMVHALNPWGMYWARRCDRDGIDVNRNFVAYDALPAADPDYPQVLDCLGIAEPQQRRTALQQLVQAWGQVRFDEVFSGGQYEHPWAPFYGGRNASFSRHVIEELIGQWQLAACECMVLDLHTGLGPWAYGELISDHPLGSQANASARELFGEAVAITASGASFSVPKAGLQDYHWHHLMARAGWYLTLEFGSYSNDELFNTLLDEHLYWRDQQPAHLDEPSYLVQRRAMLGHFCPADEIWQQAVLFKAWQVVQRVLESCQ